MIRFLVSLHLLLFLGCADSVKESNTIVEEPEPESTPIILETITSKPVKIIPVIPDGAVFGNYNGDSIPFYARVRFVDNKNQITYIAFENDFLPQILIPKSNGGEISKVSLNGFDRDLLLVTAKLKDPNFKKYFLYVLRDNIWKPVMNGFAIHLTNLAEVDQPFKLNPNNPNELLRYYSVFNLDASNPLGYTWLLLEESVPIENN